MLYPRERSQLSEMLAPVSKWDEILFLRQTVGKRPGQDIGRIRAERLKKKKRARLLRA